MSYATVTQLRKYLKQLPSGASYDAELQDVLDAATGIIDALLGFSYEALAALPSPHSLYAPYPASVFLRLPTFQAGSVDRVLQGDDEEEISDWRELPHSVLVRTVEPFVHPAEREKWEPGQLYTVHAIWGVGEAPATIVEICRQIAVNLWHSGAASRFTGGALVGAGVASLDPSGQKGGARRYADFLTPAQEVLLLREKRKYTWLVM